MKPEAKFQLHYSKEELHFKPNQVAVVKVMIEISTARPFLPNNIPNFFHDVKLMEPIDYTCRDKVVHWDRTGLDYTFIFFAMMK